jgi:hypothetical protein
MLPASNATIMLPVAPPPIRPAAAVTGPELQSAWLTAKAVTWPIAFQVICYRSKKTSLATISI